MTRLRIFNGDERPNRIPEIPLPLHRRGKSNDVQTAEPPETLVRPQAPYCLKAPKKQECEVIFIAQGVFQRRKLGNLERLDTKIPGRLFTLFVNMSPGKTEDDYNRAVGEIEVKTNEVFGINIQDRTIFLYVNESSLMQIPLGVHYSLQETGIKFFDLDGNKE